MSSLWLNSLSFTRFFQPSRNKSLRIEHILRSESAKYDACGRVMRREKASRPAPSQIPASFIQRFFLFVYSLSLFLFILFFSLLV